MAREIKLVIESCGACPYMYANGYGEINCELTGEWMDSFKNAYDADQEIHSTCTLVEV